MKLPDLRALRDYLGFVAETTDLEASRLVVARAEALSGDDPGVDSLERLFCIAVNVGFADSNYFTRVFTRSQGVSPRTYRSRRNLAVPRLPPRPAGVSARGGPL